jgi:predicted enzyme involved in methoxymalonyl-ACP biosynthesis
MIVLAIQVTDIYGDNGIAGVCIVRLEGACAFIDTFLLSCRVMGRNVEFAFLKRVLELLRENGVGTVRALYKRTGKNEAAMDFYPKAGFTAVSAGQDETAYRLEAAELPDGIEYIETVMKGETTLWTKNS